MNKTENPPPQKMQSQFDQIEQFISRARQIEKELQDERLRFREFESKAKQTFKGLQEQQHKDQKTLQECRMELAKNKGTLSRFVSQETEARAQVMQLQTEVAELTAQLRRYQAGWGTVLKREKLAQELHGQAQKDLMEVDRVKAELEEERRRTKKFEKEGRESRETYDRLLNEEKDENRELSIQLSKVRAAHSAQSEYEKTLQERVRGLSEEMRTVRDELGRYKESWALVLEREREAKEVLLHREKDRATLEVATESVKAITKQLQEEKERREQIERHAKRYETELQHALVRLHSAESRFSELTKEQQALAHKKRSFDEEIAKIEGAIRERFEWEYAKEKERFKAEVEKDSSLAQERFRTEVRESLRHEYEQRLLLDQQRYGRTQTGVVAGQPEVIDSLRQAFYNEKARYDREAEVIRSELEALKTSLPLKQVLMAKDLELKKAKAKLGILPPLGEAAQRLSENLKALEKEREAVAEELCTAEKQIAQQLEKVKIKGQVNSVTAVPVQGVVGTLDGAVAAFEGRKVAPPPFLHRNSPVANS